MVLTILWHVLLFLLYAWGTLADLAECLGPSLASHLVTPSSADYETLSTGLLARVPRSPSAILELQSLSDVATAVRCARENGISPVARSGKHSYESLSSMDGQLVMDRRAFLR